MELTQDQQLSELFSSERSSLRMFLKHKLRDSCDVDDLVQESYLRLHNAFRNQQIENARGFLYRIASNLVIDRYRSLEYNTRSLSIDNLSASAPTLVSESPSPEQCAETDEQLSVLNRIIESLPPRCRQVFLSYRVKQMTQREIACDLGISTQMVERHVAKAARICSDQMVHYR